MRELKTWMGHSSYQMINEVYDPPTGSDAHAALKKLFG